MQRAFLGLLAGLLLGGPVGWMAGAYVPRGELSPTGALAAARDPRPEPARVVRRFDQVDRHSPPSPQHERADVVRLLGRPPAAPAERPDAAAIEAWIRTIAGELRVDEVDCTTWPCTVALSSATGAPLPPDFADAVKARHPGAWVLSGTEGLRGKEGAQGTWVTLALLDGPLEGPLESRFVQRLTSAAKARTWEGRRERLRAADAEGTP